MIQESQQQFMRLLGVTENQKGEKVIRVALVSEIVDSYSTIINPKGCVSPLESVPVDYNHNRISTGAYMTDAGYTDIDIPDGHGGTKTVSAKMVDVHVPKVAIVYRDWETT